MGSNNKDTASFKSPTAEGRHVSCTVGAGCTSYIWDLDSKDIYDLSEDIYTIL
jgi:hypothetical protein